MQDVENQINEMEVIDPTPKNVTIGRGKNKKVFEVVPLVFKDYEKLFTLVGTAAQALTRQAQEGGGQFLQILQEVAQNPYSLINYADLILVVFGDALLDFLATVLECEIGYLRKNMEAPQFAVLLATIYTQNDVERIVRNFSQLAALIKKRPPFPIPQQTPQVGEESLQS